MKDAMDSDSYITKLQIFEDICKEYPLSSFGENDWKDKVIKVKNKK